MKKFNKYYDGYSNPRVWEETPYPFDLAFEEKLELFIKESNERRKRIEMKEHTKKDTKRKKAEKIRRRNFKRSE